MLLFVIFYLMPSIGCGLHREETGVSLDNTFYPAIYAADCAIRAYCAITTQCELTVLPDVEKGRLCAVITDSYKHGASAGGFLLVQIGEGT